MDCRRHADPRPRARAGARPARDARLSRLRLATSPRRRAATSGQSSCRSSPPAGADWAGSPALTRATIADGTAEARPRPRPRGRLPLSADRDAPARERAAAATTIHDLQHEAYPQFFSRPQLSYRRRVYGRSVRSSRIVIAVSEHVRDDLVERLGSPAERVRVIHHGVDHDRFTLEAAGKREPFLLYPANWWPHKNHELLLEAFASVRRERPELRLVLTGSDHPARPLPTASTSLGRVSDERLVELYRSAAALVFPSLYEGFGLPPLEAMACGCPVAVSRVALAPRGLRRRRRLLRPDVGRRTSRAGSSTFSTGRPPGGPSRPPGSPGRSSRTRHDAVYRELAGGRRPPDDDALPLHHAADLRERVLRARRRGADAHAATTSAT